MNRERSRITVSLPLSRRPSVGPWFWLCLVAVAASGISSVAQDPTSQRPLDYSSFQIITERNIFDANRSGRARERSADEAPQPARVDAFTLVGTLSYGKGPFAFFNGTTSDYRKVLRPGETIAGYKVTDISTGQVTLAAETNQLELKVGMELRREDAGAWQRREHAEQYGSVSSHHDSRSNDSGSRDSRSDESRRGDSRGFDARRSDSRGYDSRRGDSRGEPSRTIASTSPTPSSTSNAGRPSLSSAEESEILKRLIEQRERELK